MIHHVALEYRGAPGVLVLYSRGTRVVHNEIYALPSTAISTVSAGWLLATVDIDIATIDYYLSD